MESVEQFWRQHALGGDDSLAAEPAVEALCQLYQLYSLSVPDHVLVLDSPLAGAIAWRAVGLFSGPLGLGPPTAPARTTDLQNEVNWLVRVPVLGRLGYEPAGLKEDLWRLLESRLPWTRGMRNWIVNPSMFAPPVPYSGLGCGQPGWLAHDEMLRAEGFTPDRKWGAVHAMALAGVWDCLLTKRCAILVRRPVEVHRDEQGRLHSFTGPAYRWGDGFQGYAIHGVQVPPWVVKEPERLTLAYVWETANLEVRRVLIDRFGRRRLLEESGAIVTHCDCDGAGMPRRLFRLPGQGCYVEVRCPSTAHEHILCVPPTVKTCHEAVAWTFGKTPEEYAPALEA